MVRASISKLRCCSGILICWAASGCVQPSAGLSPGSLTDLAAYHAPDDDVDRGPVTEVNPAPELGEDAELPDLLAYAALNNPGLEAAFNRWKAALQRDAQVTSLPDPRFTYRYFIREVETRVGPQKQALGLSQTFPWIGKLALRGDVANQEAKAAKRRYDARKLQLFYEVKEAYWDYYYLTRAIDVVTKTRDLLVRLEGVARERYKTSTAVQAEVLKAQVELGKLEDRLAALVDWRRPVVARLNAAMNRPVDAKLPDPRPPVEETFDLSEGDVIDMALQVNPDLAALDHLIARRRHDIALANKEFYPDITLGIDYTEVGSPPRMSGAGLSNPAALRSLSRLGGGMGDGLDLYALGKSFQSSRRPGDAGKDVWMVSVSMNLPIRRAKYSAGVREAQARHRVAIGERADRVNSLSARISRALFDFRDAERKIDLYRDTLIPKGRQNLGATEAAYRTATMSFLDLIDAERDLLAFELEYEKALTDRTKRLAELDRLVGQDIPRTQKETDETVTP